jgi:hypothetical protein
VPPHGGAAVAAEGAGDGFARVRRLGDLLRLAAQDLEVCDGNYDVVAVVAPADLAAVCAVAKGLCALVDGLRDFGMGCWV